MGGGGAQHGPRSGTTSLPGVSSGGQTTASGSKFTLKGLATAFARFRKMSQALSKMPTDKPMTRVSGRGSGMEHARRAWGALATAEEQLHGKVPLLPIVC